MWETLLLLVPEIDNSEIVLYYQSAESVLNGQVPYDDFLWIYSPAFLLLMILLVTLTGSTQGFVYVYFGLLLVSLLFLAVQLYRYSFKSGYQMNSLQMFWLAVYMAVVAIGSSKVFINLDVLASALLVQSMLWRDQGKIARSVGLLGIIFSLRPFVLLLLPVWLIGLRVRDYGKLIGWFLLPSLVSLIPFGWYRNSWDYGYSLLFQNARMVQLESVSASVMWLVSRLGIPIWTNVDRLHQAINPVWGLGAVGDWLVEVVVTVPLLLAGYLCWRVWRRQVMNMELLSGLSLLLVLALLIQHPVLSPQYLIWLWAPFGLWLISSWESVGRIRGLGYMALLGVVFILTSSFLVYYNPWMLPALFELSSLPMWIITIRNGLLVGLFGLVGRRVYESLVKE